MSPYGLRGDFEGNVKENSQTWMGEGGRRGVNLTFLDSPLMHVSIYCWFPLLFCFNYMLEMSKGYTKKAVHHLIRT